MLFNSRLRLFPGKLKSKWSGPYTVVSSTTYGAITLKTSTGEEFKVNSQRLKHYLSRESGKEELQLVDREKEGLRKKNKTASPAKDSKRSSSWEATHIDFYFLLSILIFF